MSPKLAVNEYFGPTVQGEGPSLGKRAVFLRLAMCNLKCSWCDTKFTWDWQGEFGKKYEKSNEVHLREVEDVWNDLSALGDVPLLVITGGEPLLQQNALIYGSEDYGWPTEEIEFETNGTVAPHLSLLRDERVSFNVSPKLENSGNPLEKRFKPRVLDELASSTRARFKFVVVTEEDLKEVDLLVRTIGIESNNVWIMPEGTTAYTISSRTAGLAEEVIRRGYNLTTRLHVLVWGDKRGV